MDPKLLIVFLLIFAAGGHLYFFSVEDSSCSSISCIGGIFCLLQKDPLRAPDHSTSQPGLPSDLRENAVF